MSFWLTIVVIKTSLFIHELPILMPIPRWYQFNVVSFLELMKKQTFVFYPFDIIYETTLYNYYFIVIWNKVSHCFATQTCFISFIRCDFGKRTFKWIYMCIWMSLFEFSSNIWLSAKSFHFRDFGHITIPLRHNTNVTKTILIKWLSVERKYLNGLWTVIKAEYYVDWDMALRDIAYFSFS